MSARKFAVDLAASYVNFKDAPIDRVTAAYADTAVQTPILTDAHAVVLSIGGRLKL